MAQDNIAHKEFWTPHLKYNQPYFCLPQLLNNFDPPAFPLQVPLAPS